MTDIRENLGYFIGSVITAFALLLGWIYQSGVLNTLVGVAIGAGIAYYVQTRTQNRAWRREYAVKIAEEVYGNLFKSLRNIIQSLESKHQIYWISFDSWKEFQQDHRYFMVDKNFRDRLDDFSKKLDSYSKAAVEMGNKVRKIIMEETERVFGKKIRHSPRLQITYMNGYSRVETNSDLVECLVSETYPIDFLKTSKPEATGIDFNLEVTLIDNIQSKMSYATNPRVLGFDGGFWQTCLKRMKENETYKFVTEENCKILEEAKKVQEEIIKRIEEPWKI